MKDSVVGRIASKTSMIAAVDLDGRVNLLENSPHALILIPSRLSPIVKFAQSVG